MRKLDEIENRWYAVFRSGILIKLTQSSEEGTRAFLGTDQEEGTPADGMYKISSLEELSQLLKKEMDKK